MSETITGSTDTVQQNAEINPQDKVLARLSQDFGGETVKTLDPPKTEPVTETKTDPPTTEPPKTEPTELAAEEIEALKTKAKDLGLPENATKEQIAEAEKTKADSEWKLDQVVKTPQEENDGSWKGVIAELGLGDVPADYAEEKGFEIVQDLFQKKLDAVKNEALSEAKFDRYVDVPEQHRAEAEMFIELMKSGQSPQDIVIPLLNIQQAKTLEKEVLVRNFYENELKGDQDLVDLQMQKIEESGTMDSEYKLARLKLDNIEKNILSEQKQQIETFKNNQKAIQEQRANQENLKLKVALDRVPEFLGKKLPDNVKSELIKELQTEAYRNMPGTPEQKVDYFLYNKFGKTAMKNFQDRALEKVVIENKQKQHNVPIVNTGNANRVEPNSGKSLAEQRLEQQFG